MTCYFGRRWVDPQKVETILKWERPTMMIKIHNFLGLAGYYRRFIEGFFMIATPLMQLTRRIKSGYSRRNVRKASKN